MRLSGTRVGLLVVVALSTGCSPGRLEQAERKLKASNDRNTQLLSTARDLEVCRQENAKTKEWKDRIEADLLRAAPPTIQKEYAAQVEQDSTLPQQIRVEVQRRVDRFFIVVMKELNEEKRRSEQVLKALERTHTQVLKTGATVDKVVTGTTEIADSLAALKSQKEEESAREERQQRLATEAHQIVERIANFDRRIDCKSCPNGIGMFSAKKEILKFHSDLFKDLSALQQSIESQ
jgi:hypothetical protein